MIEFYFSIFIELIKNDSAMIMPKTKLQLGNLKKIIIKE